MKVTFIGLGMMGRPMAINLVKAGHEVTVVNRSQGKVKELVELGALAGSSPGEASRNAEIICLCLVGENLIEEIIAGKDGVLSKAQPNSIILDHSTVHPEFAKRMAALSSSNSITYMDAPVSGTGKVAWDGQLTVMVGGNEVKFQRIAALLDSVASNVQFMGPVGTGNIAKLINNMVKDINQIAVMESFVLAQKLNMDLHSLFQVMRTASAASRQLERIGPKILSRAFEQTSYVSTNIKDQELMGWLIDLAQINLPLRDVAREHWIKASDMGLGEADPTESIKVLE
tara:strand:+ start:6330 stop:7187 length:858 start_codon:yes stop_codon:yes gene_type:complete